jgi:Transglycosylase SLT domain
MAGSRPPDLVLQAVRAPKRSAIIVIVTAWLAGFGPGGAVSRQERLIMSVALSDLAVAIRGVRSSARVFLGDVAHGMLEVSHNVLALIGILVLAVAAFALGKADLRHGAERLALQWLQEREEMRAEREGDVVYGADEQTALARATAAHPAELDRQQAAVASWLAKRYHVAPEPLNRLVQEAWEVGRLTQLKPTLILAIMAVESSFNPFAQSPVGAQGLMQVMTKVHTDKYEPFGGSLTAFDPITNLRVGVLVLKECIARAGGLEQGLRHYVGAANLSDDGGYAAKVLAEQAHLNAVAAGRSVALNAPLPTAAPGAAAATAASTSPASPPAAVAVPAAPAASAAQPQEKPTPAVDHEQLALAH